MYRRDEDLSRRINAFLCDTFHLPSNDYFGAMDLSSKLELKSVLSDINNTLTMQLTLGFVDWAAKILQMDHVAVTRLRNEVLSTKPSTNGYHVWFAHVPPLVAEVKCNVPINGGTKYGAAQKDGINRDTEGLLNGKTKKSTASPPADSLKFMVFLDLPAVRAANSHLVNLYFRTSREFVMIQPGEVPKDPTVLYGVYANLGI
jgi:hypothetical protein